MKLKSILHELNNADQMVMGIRDVVEKNTDLNIVEMQGLHQSLERAIVLFRRAENAILTAITEQIKINMDEQPSAYCEVCNKHITWGQTFEHPETGKPLCYEHRIEVKDAE